MRSTSWIGIRSQLTALLSGSFTRTPSTNTDTLGFGCALKPRRSIVRWNGLPVWS